MSVAAIQAEPAVEPMVASARPYAPSALNRFFAAVERLPGGGWWVYPGMFLGLIVYHQVSLWVTGARPIGSISVDGIQGLVYGPFSLLVLHYILRVAARSIATFRPATGLTDADYALRRYELVTVPAGRLWIAPVIGGLVAAITILSAPVAALAPFGGTVERVLIVYGPAAVFGYGMLCVDVYQTIRTLRQVERLHREATALDLYDTAPIYAFSRLTAQIGIVFVFSGYYGLVASAAFQTNAVALSVIAATVLLGVACFIVPLWGIHGRLVAAKAELVRGTNLRGQALQEELYRRVDAANLTGIKDVTDALGGVHATREQIARLPTWPWPPQVLRGFISAILLPVVVFLITRFVGGQIVR